MTESNIDVEVALSEVTENKIQPERGLHAVANSLANRLAILVLNAGTGILTARALLPAGRGELAAMNLWPLFLAFTTTLGIPSALIYLLKQDHERESENIATGLVMSLGMGITAAILGAACLPLWLRREYSLPVIHAAQAFLVFTPLLALTTSGRAVMEAKGIFSVSNRMQVLSPATTLVGLLILLWTHQMTPLRAGAMYMLGAIPPFILLVYKLLPFIRSLSDVTAAAARSLLGYGIRSYGVDLLGTLALQVDQVLVISLLPPAAMGAYGVVLSLSRMLNLFHASVVMVLFPKAAGQPAEVVIDLTERSARVSTAITAASAVFVSFFGFTILHLLYGKEYINSTGPLRLLLLEVMISGVVYIFSQAFMALGHPGVVTILQGLGLSLSIPLMLWFVPRLGITGAALSLLLSTIARFIFVLLGFRYILKTRIPRLLPKAEDFHLFFGMINRAKRRA